MRINFQTVCPRERTTKLSEPGGKSPFHDEIILLAKNKRFKLVHFEKRKKNVDTTTMIALYAKYCTLTKLGIVPLE